MGFSMMSWSVLFLPGTTSTTVWIASWKLSSVIWDGKNPYLGSWEVVLIYWKCWYGVSCVSNISNLYGITVVPCNFSTDLEPSLRVMVPFSGHNPVAMSDCPITAAVIKSMINYYWCWRRTPELRQMTSEVNTNNQQLLGFDGLIYLFCPLVSHGLFVFKTHTHI